MSASKVKSSTKISAPKSIKEALIPAEGTACVVLGGSSLTSLDTKGEVKKHSFYPTSVEEYIKGIVEIGLDHSNLSKDKPGVLVVAAPGAFQNEGTIAGLPPNFHRVREDAIQRGMPNLFFRQLVEDELEKRGYIHVKAFGYNDAVPALSAVMSQSNTEEVLGTFEKELKNTDRSEYAIVYMINGTGTGEATLNPDSNKIVTAEKGHLKPNLLWYELNPFFKFMTRFPIVGQNRSIERLVAGGPDKREARHFTKILNAVLDVLNDKKNPELEGLSRVLGFTNYDELLRADGENGILKTKMSTETASSLVQLGQAVKAGSKLAIEFRNIFAKALGASLAHMHFAIGEMPDPPLNTFIGPIEVRNSFLGFLRSDGSTTALIAGNDEAWTLLEQTAQNYAKAILDGRPHLLRVKDINSTFPNIHPDFGGLPTLAENKLAKLKR
jgi:hypothetical protein